MHVLALRTPDDASTTSKARRSATLVVVPHHPGMRAYDGLPPLRRLLGRGWRPIDDVGLVGALLLQVPRFSDSRWRSHQVGWGEDAPSVRRAAGTARWLVILAEVAAFLKRSTGLAPELVERHRALPRSTNARDTAPGTKDAQTRARRSGRDGTTTTRVEVNDRPGRTRPRGPLASIRASSSTSRAEGRCVGYDGGEQPCSHGAQPRFDQRTRADTRQVPSRWASNPAIRSPITPQTVSRCFSHFHSRTSRCPVNTVRVRHPPRARRGNPKPSPHADSTNGSAPATTWPLVAPH